MKIQYVRIGDIEFGKSAVAELLIADSPDGDIDQDFVKFRLTIPVDPNPSFLGIERVALIALRAEIDELIDEIEQIRSRTGS